LSLPKAAARPKIIGGLWGFAEYLEAMSDPHHPRHAESVKWLGRRDPNEIGIAAMEAALGRFVKPATLPTRRAAKKMA
jgi:hypothetical protein